MPHSALFSWVFSFLLDMTASVESDQTFFFHAKV